MDFFPQSNVIRTSQRLLYMKFKCGIASDIVVIFCHVLVDKSSFVKMESIDWSVVIFRY
jgi:hypothetical protein